MIKKIIGLWFILIFLSPSLLGARTDVRIAISDFKVHLDNPQYKYFGKGFAEFIGVEISKIREIALIAREEQLQVLEELQFSSSDLVSEKAQIKLGKMLTANYKVFGNIFDMAGEISITFKVISVGTGKVILQGKVKGKVSNYDYISASIAKKILAGFNIKIPEKVSIKIKRQKEKSTDAVIFFSKAVDAFDKKDMRKAKKELNKAKKLDPENEAVALYLSKLTTTSPKYKVQLEMVAPTDNPATLGFLKQDKMYVLQSMPTDTSEGEMQGVGDDYTIGEIPMASRVGYAFPLTERLGITIEFIFAHNDSKIQVKDSLFNYFGFMDSYFHPMTFSYGGCVGIGYSLTEFLILGAAMHGYYSIEKHHGNDSIIGDWEKEFTGWNFAGDIGVLFKIYNDILIFDSHGVFTTQEEYFLDTRDKVVKKARLPLIIENTLTAAFFDKKIFIVLKNINDIYSGKRSGTVICFIPVIEFWPVQFLSLRGGVSFHNFKH